MILTCVTAVFNAIKSGNRERLIRCVESVAALKTEHEHLIYDGASTDGTVELLRELEAKTPGLKVVSEPDTGIYNALNKGVRDAKGEWFYVLGCDDYICHPEVMDRVIAEAGEVEIIVAPVERDKGFPFFHKNSDLWGILWHVPYSHQGTIMRTDVVRGFGGFDERFRICADWDMMRKAHDAAKKFKYTYKPFAFYRAEGASEIGEIGGREMQQVVREHAWLSESEYGRARRVGYYPLAKTLHYCAHHDKAYRIAGRHMLFMMIKPFIRYTFYPIVIATRPIRHRTGTR